MKKTILILSITFLSFTNCYSQHSLKPSMQYNIWNIGGFSPPSMEFGVDYEYGVNNQLGISGGLSYTTWMANYYSSTMLSINGGLVYYFEQLYDGMFLGGNLGFSLSGHSYVEIIPRFGYSVELGQGTLNPSIGIGHASLGESGYRFGGLLIPIGASYTISF